MENSNPILILQQDLLDASLCEQEGKNYMNIFKCQSLRWEGRQCLNTKHVLG